MIIKSMMVTNMSQNLLNTVSEN